MTRLIFALKSTVFAVAAGILALSYGLIVVAMPVASAESPIGNVLSDAFLILRADSIGNNWQPEDGWQNEGTAGSALNANFVDETTNIHPEKMQATRIPATSEQPGGFLNAMPDNDLHHYVNGYGYFIPHSPLFNIPSDEGGFTAVFDITAENVLRASKLAWLYEGVALPESPGGWVIEHLPVPDDYPGEPLENQMVTAAYDGTNWAASLYKKMIPGRHRIAFRIDANSPQSSSWSMFRNGTKVSGGGAPNGIGNMDSVSELLFGPGYTVHNVAMFDRALSDREMAEVDAEIAYPSCVNVPQDNCDVDKDGVTDIVENAAPNNGDGNDDGLPDRLQVSVVSGTQSNQYSVMSAPNTTRASSVSYRDTLNITPEDGRAYPFGLLSYDLLVDQEMDYPIEITYFTDQPASQTQARKFNTASQEFSDIEGAVLSDSTVAGRHVVKVQYSVRDGGINDEDGQVNGRIVDPVVLSMDRDSVDGYLASTGTSVGRVTLFAILTLATSLSIIFFYHRKSKP